MNDVEQATLEVIDNSPNPMIDLNCVIRDTAGKLGNTADRKTRFAVATFLNDLIRNGILAFGNNDGGWCTEAAYLTEPGRKTLEHASRDPINKNGYMKYLDEQIVLDAVARMYSVSSEATA